ncbi:MAG TPA: glycosyltransferase family 4 protein [Syntrophobacteraceae bacterium]|nr:glycosyltransferase family 4 protein [Syntrophobacteraceae bacterium]
MAVKKSRRIVHLTSVHRQDDVRIYRKECISTARGGYQVTLISPGSGTGCSNGVNLVSVPMPAHRFDRMFKTIRFVYRAAVSLGADLYHFHDPELMIVGLLLKMKGKRVVYDVHEELGEDIKDKEWLPKSLRPAMALLVGLFESFCSKFYDGIVVSRSALLERFEPKKTVLVSNYPIIGELSTEAPIPFSARPGIGAYVGGVTPERGIRQLAAGLSMLPKDCDFHLHIAGTLPPALLEEVSRMPGGHRLKFLGWQTREQVAELLNRARFGVVLFLPIANHLRSEPTKIYEYMSCGLPVIATDMPYWRRIVDAGGLGIVVDPYNPKAIADAVEYLLSHPEEAGAMGERGKTAIMGEYNWGKEAEKLLLLYANILG